MGLEKKEPKIINLTQRDKYISVLSKAMEYKTQFTIWQKKNDGQRISIKTTLSKLQPKSNILSFKLVETSNATEVANGDVYAHSDDNSIILKLSVTSFMGNFLITSLPMAMKIIEKRADERFDLLKYKVPGRMIRSGDGPELAVNGVKPAIRIINISKKGALIRIVQNESRPMTIDEDISIDKIGSNELSAIHGKVRHTHSMKVDGVAYQDFGVSFNNGINVKKLINVIGLGEKVLT